MKRDNSNQHDKRNSEDFQVAAMRRHLVLSGYGPGRGIPVMPQIIRSGK